MRRSNVLSICILFLLLVAVSFVAVAIAKTGAEGKEEVVDIGDIKVSFILTACGSGISYRSVDGESIPFLVETPGMTVTPLSPLSSPPEPVS